MQQVKNVKIVDVGLLSHLCRYCIVIFYEKKHKSIDKNAVSTLQNIIYSISNIACDIKGKLHQDKLGLF